MSEEGTKIPLKTVGVVALFVGAVSLLYWSWTANVGQPTIERGRYCISCKKTSATEDYMMDYPKNWVRHPRGGDTGMVCILCKKGPAFLTDDCETCETVYLLDYLPNYNADGDNVCPKCDAEYGQMARSKGVDLMPKALNP